MFATPAYAQAAAGASAGGGASSIFMFAQFALIGLIFWFLMIRPEQKRQKERRARLDAIKKNDQVLTGGGLVAKVIKVDGEYVELEIANGVRVKAMKATITDLITPTLAKPAND
jgi:preprotein translocase subunit YajC